MTLKTDDLTTFAEHLAHESAKVILPLFRQPLDVENKRDEQDWDPVTEADKGAERVIRALIEKHYPEHGIIGEEYGVKETGSDFKWVLDPVDGTRAFVIGIPTWATLIGLYYQGKPLLGVMHQPYVGDLFIGNPNGAWLEHKGQRSRLKASGRTDLKSAMAGTVTPNLYERQPGLADRFKTLSTNVKSMRYGGDAYFFAMVAAGHLDIAMDPLLQIYDIAALIPIIEGAGGCVGNWDGQDPSLGGNILAAATPQLRDAAIELMQIKLA